MICDIYNIYASDIKTITNGAKEIKVKLCEGLILNIAIFPLYYRYKEGFIKTKLL